MKKILMSVILAAAGILLVGCNSRDAKLKQEIVGTYNFVQTGNIDDKTEVTIGKRVTYNADGAALMSAKAEVTITMRMGPLGSALADQLMGEENTDPLVLEFDTSVSGTYYIKSSFLYHEFDDETFKVEMNENFLGERGEVFETTIAPMIETVILPTLRQQILQYYKEEILELNDERMITRTYVGDVVYERE